MDFLSYAAAVGTSFITQGIWCQNTAGLEKHQVVVLRLGSHKSVINQCTIDAYQNMMSRILQNHIIDGSDLEMAKTIIKTYLGRPWMEYSRTVVMHSYIGDHINSIRSIWCSKLTLKMLCYGEYKNRGRESDTSKSDMTRLSCDC
ncbi:Pectinesterase, catalytic [Dillenia turbinata]|uniref:Pectinesterase, catalytic n=1 Tax=Dillenia turbinata TaxID=194707 RepID=A0AAN8ZA07_9MAGN